MALTVKNGGDYLIELDTGYAVEAFELDDPVKGVLDNTTYVLDGLDDFADITLYAQSFSIRRGRQKTTDQFPTGTATITFNDSLSNQALNPFNTSSIYYNPVDDLPGLAPLRQVRISRDGQYLFVGRIQTYDLQYVLGGIDTVTVTCADDLFVLARTTINTFTPAIQTSSARITTILNLPEVAFTGTPSLTASPVATLGAYLIEDNTKTIDYLTKIQLAESGRLFCDRQNTLIFQPRITGTFSSPVASFDDTNTSIGYNDLAIDFDSSDVINRASITVEGGIPQIAEDAASIAYYYTQATTNSSSLLSDDTQALTLAQYLLTPNPTPRFTAVQTWFGSLTEAERDTVALIDIGDLISITSTAAFGTTVQESFVEGLEISVSADYGQTMKFFTSPTTVFYDFILDDPIYGILDITDPQPALS